MIRSRVLLYVIGGLLILGLTVGSGICAQPKTEKDDIYKEIEIFSDAVSLVRSEYVEEAKSKDIIYGALRGMLASLDPYSQFLDPDTYKEMKVDTSGKFGGLGIEISIKDNLLTVITPIADTPADKAGLKAGDRIVKIDGESTKDVTLIDAVKKLRGEPGSKVELMVLREKERRILDITVTRGIIEIKSIKESRILESNIGYIKLVEFQENTPEDLSKALKALEDEGMDSIILDLRNNPGGLLDVAAKVADKFLEEGKLIVYTKGRRKSQNMEFRAHKRGTYASQPLIVLVNEGSASASEIVAGAMQDNDRGIILGKKSFGKASVQTVMPLGDGSALRLTTAKYFTPSGRSIMGEGIIPDIVVEEESYKPIENKKSENIFEKLKEYAIPKDKKKDEGESDTKAEKEDEEKADDSEGKDIELEEKEVYDSQLLRAIDLIKGIKVYEKKISS
ncbi:MAG: S41 family peptidase [Candidatus Omnitrophica bacterium]|nr:S41 family peptidase [Candidatus Omnitrophota bacterium]